MNTLRKRFTVAITLSAALLAFNEPSFAGPYRKVVDYSDLNLERSGDAAVLYERIQYAARLVCRDDRVIWGYHRKSFNRCVQRTVEKAVTQVDSSALTAAHQGLSERVAER